MSFSITLELATMLGFFATAIIVIHSLRKWNKSQECLRADSFEKMMKKFEDNELYGLLRNSDDSDLQDLDLKKKENQNSLFQLLYLWNYLCYLKKKMLITQEEFALFEPILNTFLNCDVLTRYLNLTKHSPVLEIYKGIKWYDEQFHVLKSKTEDSHKTEASCKEEIEVVPQAVTDCNGELTEKDFKVPTMLIKINRLYREGMRDDEIYDVTRQWWRIRLERAEKMKYALAVSDSVVRKVFAIASWETDAEAGEDYGGRIRFIGHIAEDSLQKRWVGKSVKTLFPKGAVNPIRYFEGASE